MQNWPEQQETTGDVNCDKFSGCGQLFEYIVGYMKTAVLELFS